MNFQGKDICIIGGSGFLGTALRKFFSQEGCRLVTIGRAWDLTVVSQEQYFSIQKYTYPQLAEILSATSFAAVIDLAYATVPGTSYLDPIGDFSDNLRNVIRHLDFIRSLKIEKYLYVSSGGTVYGEAIMEQPFKETDPTIPLSPYGITKLACERYVLMYQRLYGIPGLILRPSNMYGPGQQPFRGQGLVATAFGLALRKEAVTLYGTGSTVRDYLYISDFCAAVSAICDRGAVGQIYNIGASTGTSITELVEGVDAVLAEDGCLLERIHLPERPFDVHYSVLNTTRLREATSWVPRVSLKEGLHHTWKWIKAQQLNPESPY